LIEAIAHLNLFDTAINEEITVFASLLIPYVPVDDAMMASPETTIVLAQAETKSEIEPRLELQVCELEENSFADDEYPSTAYRFPIGIYPAAVVREYFGALSGWKEEIDMRSSKTTIVEYPKYAALEPSKEDSRLGGQGFSPHSKKWVGADKLTALVEFNGQVIRVKMDIVVVRRISNRGGYGDGFSGGGEALDAVANECMWRGYTEVERLGISESTGIPPSEDKEEKENEGEGCNIDPANWYSNASLLSLRRENTQKKPPKQKGGWYRGA
jgi:hypothetical protein